ncbi:biotin synthase BioB [Synechococcus sp. PCC 7336]|uniref:biotin synthase BioB n=1 Tax=Synechococcus sp. PCC 7336 TaxID=195250 RepID=UPI00034BE3D7|nr:biotin synthase BioB [Synechococcus sp. PCC 7336]
MVSLARVEQIYRQPFTALLFEAQTVHRQSHPPDAVQLCTLANIKSGRCPEDCKYCPQSARYDTPVEDYALLPLETIIEQAKVAKANGSTRFCMGAAWRQVPDGPDFDRVLAMVRAVVDLEMEACVTLGMLRADQAKRLAEAGLTAYNHNLDTSATFYPEIISTRTYRDRLDTIAAVSAAGIQVCCGGILGLGESELDRIELLHTLANLDPQPESVPVNALVPVEGTPFGDRPLVSAIDLARTIATARILMPRAVVRLSAGRNQMSASDQALCFLAGANSIFTGEKLLTTENPGSDADAALFQQLGLTPWERLPQRSLAAAEASG